MTTRTDSALETNATDDITADQLAHAAIKTDRRSKHVGLAIFAVFTLAMFVFPIASGALSSGVLSVEGARVAVQHPSGGVIEEVLVKEGDIVKAGDPLMRLDAIQAEAASAVAIAELDSLRAEEAVRRAEAEGAAAVTFPPVLEKRRQEPTVRAMLEAQEAAFTARAAASSSAQRQVRQRIDGAMRERAAIEAQRTAAEEQVRLLDQELASLRTLVEQGLTPRNRVLGVERLRAQAQGQVEFFTAERARADVSIGELQTELERSNLDRRMAASDALKSIQTELAAATNRAAATGDIANRAVVRAPISGAVFSLKTTTAGSVIGPGQVILEIAPEGAALFVRSRLAPRDASRLKAGDPATVRLDSVGAKGQIRLQATVRAISPDVLTDPRTGELYFEVNVAIVDPKARTMMAELTPGQPATVLIRTGAHTLAEYLFAPLFKGLFTAARDA